MGDQLNNLTEERYIAGMILSGVGDALGYKNGWWEFCADGVSIQKELCDKYGGLDSVSVESPDWPVSDDTVMHLATGEALIEKGNNTDKFSLYQSIAEHYKRCMRKMQGRAAGITCMEMCKQLNTTDVPKGLCIPFNPRGGGCGAAMRSMCIGLRYPRIYDLDDLIAVSIESGRLTHHHPTGYLGSLTSALFTSYAVQGKPLREWGVGLLETIDKAKIYIAKKSRIQPLHGDEYSIHENETNSDYFRLKWEIYLEMRNISDTTSELCYSPDEDNVKKRDQLYRWLSYDDVGGASGHDAPMIAFDALLKCNQNWKKLCNHAMFHGGDSDSTGVIAGCLYGILYGLRDVPDCNYRKLELTDELKEVGKGLFDLVDTKTQESELTRPDTMSNIDTDNGNTTSFVEKNNTGKNPDNHTGIESSDIGTVV